MTPTRIPLLFLLCALPVLVLGLAPRAEPVPVSTATASGSSPNFTSQPATASTAEEADRGSESSTAMLPRQPSRQSLQLTFVSLWALLVGLRLASLARDVMALRALKSSARPLPRAEERRVHSWIRETGVARSLAVVEVDRQSSDDGG